MTRKKSAPKPSAKAATATCTRPDRDVPGIVCGYPKPCPHHTVVLEERDLGAAIPTVLWIEQTPMIAICHAIAAGDPSHIIVTGIASVKGVSHRLEVWKGERRLPLTSPMSALRDAFDELTREGHVALEGYQYR